MLPLMLFYVHAVLNRCLLLTLAVALSSASFSTMSFSLSCPYPISSVILLYNKEVVSSTLCSPSASASHVAATGADTALYNFVNWFLIQLVMFIICFRGKFFQILWSFLRHSPDSQKNDYLMPYSINVFLMTYSSFIFICVDTSGQRFLITYSPLIFI